MEGLSIEEKAKAYDEAIKRAKAIIKIAANQDEAVGFANTIFPELKESEDEKIKNFLIDYISHIDWGDWDFSRKQCIDWLEKQGRRNDYDNNVITRNDEMLQAISIGLSDIKEDVGWSDFGGIPIEELQEWLKKQGEQKPDDKVEPKFKVGDWIINSESGYIRQILKINNCCYETDYGVLPIKDYESVFRLWTIQDAKAGDVLAFSFASQNYILIYKGLYEKSFKTIMSVFCFYSVEEDAYYHETDSFHIMNRGEIITLATKEQRDTLFAKMREDGYEWDTEKKELKKIENRPMLSDFFNAEYERGKADALKGIKWSEEDEEFFNDTIAFFEDTKNALDHADWLRSLKDRLQPKRECDENERLQRIIETSCDRAEKESLIQFTNKSKI